MSIRCYRVSILAREPMLFWVLRSGVHHYWGDLEAAHYTLLRIFLRPLTPSLSFLQNISSKQVRLDRAL